MGLNMFPAGATSRTDQVSKTDPVAKLKNDLAQAQKDASAAATRYSSAYGALEKLNDELADTKIV
ncbi:MAG TPA: hypothetical protein PLT55_02855 [Acidimicrobiia bacterium]|nr:hypothetical protein [Acidimicrobiia bacterium]